MKLRASMRTSRCSHTRGAFAYILLTLCFWKSDCLRAQSYLPEVSAKSSETQVEVTPYVWILHINSDDQLGPTSLNSNLPFSRILRSLKGLGELEAVAKDKKFLFLETASTQI